MYFQDIVGQRFSDLARDVKDKYISKQSEHSSVEKHLAYAFDAEILGHQVASSLVGFVRSIPTAFRSQVAHKIRSAANKDLFSSHLSMDRELEEEIGKKVNACFLMSQDQDDNITEFKNFMKDDYQSYAYVTKEDHRDGYHYDPELLNLRNGAAQSAFFKIMGAKQFLTENLRDQHLKIANIFLDYGFRAEDKFDFTIGYREKGLEQVQALAKIKNIADIEGIPSDLITKLLSKFTNEDLIAAQKILTKQVKAKADERIVDNIKVTYAELSEWQKSVYKVAGNNISWKNEAYKPMP